MDKSKIGFIVIILGIFLLGLGIGIKFKDGETNTNLYTIAGLTLSSIGLILTMLLKKNNKD